MVETFSSAGPQGKAKLRVVFLLFYFEGWDSFEGVYRAMQRHPRFEPIIVAIPRKLTGYEGWGDLDKVTDFLDERGLEYESLDQADSFEGLERLKIIAPDYIFLNYPWMRNYQPGYQIENLLWARLAYVPYFSLSLVNEPGVAGVAHHQYTQPLHQFARLVFTGDLQVTRALQATDRGGRGARGVVFTGSPKLDTTVERAAALTRQSARWPIAHDPSRFRLVWAPHHSYDDNWLNFGNFADVYKKMLKYATKHPEIDVVLRPHPFLFSTMTGRGVLKRKVLKTWRKQWLALPNTAIDAESDFVDLFMASDALFTDGISFIAEYPLAVGRPAIFLERADHWSFSELGEVAAQASVRVSSMKQFKQLMRQLRAGQALPDRSAEIAALRKVAHPHPGQTAERILQAVLEDWG